MKQRIIRIVLALAIAAAISFTWNYFSLLKTTKQLASDLDRTIKMASKLKVQLNRQIVDNKRLKEEGIILERKVASAQQEIARSKSAIGKLEEDLSSLKIHVGALEKNNVVLRKRINKLALLRRKLRAKLKELIKEKESLQARFYSLKELKKAIRELRRDPSKQREFLDIKDDKPSSDGPGNQGYLIKRGESTYKPNINIRVLPVP